jgi:para-nitrobenzyl esterase
MPPVRPDLVSVVVKTNAGPVEGRVSDGIASFKGIPFAAPPFGRNRFRPPEPPEPWTEVRAAHEYGAVPPQPPYPGPFRHMLGDSGITGEDCLNLNVWSPDAGAGDLPVMVWIPGGAFFRGSGALPVYEGSHFARDGVVCVTINYRVGADGFLWLGDRSANFGLLDQLAALRWVQDNIRAFGGDPGKVTVFGESAGAFSVASLIAIRESAGLFRRAILQSGAGHHVLSTATARMVGAMLCERLGVPPSYDALAAVPLDRFVEAQAALDLERVANPDPKIWGEVAINGMMFEPVIDGEILRQRPIDAMTGGAGAGLEVLVGSTTEEWRFFVVPTGVIDLITEDRVQGLASRQGLDPPKAVAGYREADPEASAGDVYAALISDFSFRIPAIRLAEAQLRNGSEVHVYEFGWRSPMYDGRLGACHALEIGFVFDNLDQGGPMAGDHPPQPLADAMHRAWVNFASTGDPGWPGYDLSRRPVMRFDAHGGEVVNDPAGSTRQLWEGIR